MLPADWQHYEASQWEDRRHGVDEGVMQLGRGVPRAAHASLGSGVTMGGPMVATPWKPNHDGQQSAEMVWTPPSLRW